MYTCTYIMHMCVHVYNEDYYLVHSILLKVTKKSSNYLNNEKKAWNRLIGHSSLFFLHLFAIFIWYYQMISRDFRISIILPWLNSSRLVLLKYFRKLFNNYIIINSTFNVSLLKIVFLIMLCSFTDKEHTWAIHVFGRY